jgi:hypothetical protein
MYYRKLSLTENLFAYSSVALVSWSLPVRMDRPSSIFLWFLNIFYVIPAIFLTFYMGSLGDDEYYPLVLALDFAMILSAVVVQRWPRSADRRFAPDEQMVWFLVAAWVFMTSVLIFVFGGTMSVAGIDDIYYQRSLAQDADVAGMVSYIRTYYGYVANPLLIGIGLFYDRKGLLSMGMAGVIISYMIDAQKMNIIMAIGMVGIHFMMRRGFAGVWVYTSGVALISAISYFSIGLYPMSEYVADVILLRAIAIPGGTFVQYFDLFYSEGFTHWSSVTGIGMLVDAPAAFASDPAWPQLGIIVGREYFPWATGLNHSASLFAGEGAAAAGALGVVVIGIALAIFLKVFDTVARNWAPQFVLVSIVPIAMALSNAHLSTVLVSFGGGFWLLLLGFYRPRMAQASEPATTP